MDRIAFGLRSTATPALAARAQPIPVILDTDIDDTFALLMLFRSKELDLKLVVTDFGDTVYRARLAAKLLEAMGRPDVPVGVGVRQHEKGGAQAEWLRTTRSPATPGRCTRTACKPSLTRSWPRRSPSRSSPSAPPRTSKSRCDEIRARRSGPASSG